MILVGIAGKARAGKDTVARTLVEEEGFTRIAYADRLKLEVRERFASTLDSWLYDSPYSTLEEAERDRAPFLRALWQDYGTKVRRRDRANYWLAEWEEEVVLQLGDPRTWQVPTATRIVVPDVRMANEAEHIRRYGGQLWLVVRPGMTLDPAVDADVTEQQVAEWDIGRFDAVLPNVGTVDDLRERVRQRLLITVWEPRG